MYTRELEVKLTSEGLLSLIEKNDITIDSLKDLLKNSESKINIHVTNKEGSTLLMLAVTNSNIDLVKLLLEEKANIDIQNKNGSTALILAAKYNHGSIMRMLLNAKANVNIQNNDGKSALGYCASHNDSASIMALLAEKANVNVKDKDGSTPLIEVAKGDTAIIRMLLEAKAEVNVEAHERTPLGLAAHAGNLDSVEELIEARADVNAGESRFGLTAIHWATRSSGCNIDLLKTLIDAKADIPIEKSIYSSLSIIAKQCGQPEECIKLLKNAEKEAEKAKNPGWFSYLFGYPKLSVNRIDSSASKEAEPSQYRPS